MMEEGGAAERARERESERARERKRESAKVLKRERESEMWNGLHVCGDWEGEVLIVGQVVDCDRLVVIRRMSSR